MVDLVAGVVHVSMQMLRIVGELPVLNFAEKSLEVKTWDKLQ